MRICSAQPSLRAFPALPRWPNCSLALLPAQFPGLINGCTTDWYLPWPEEALAAVSSKFLDSFAIECAPEVKGALKQMMASVHVQVTEACKVGSRQLGWGWGWGLGEDAQARPTCGVVMAHCFWGRAQLLAEPALAVRHVTPSPCRLPFPGVL